ncbi:MAG: hypothetical protein ACT4NL_16970 [Pseudomarimonas sp.]
MSKGSLILSARGHLAAGSRPSRRMAVVLLALATAAAWRTRETGFQGALETFQAAYAEHRAAGQSHTIEDLALGSLA